MDRHARRGLARGGAGVATEKSRRSPFPGRDLILFLSFVIILATLVVQGLSLPPLIRWLGVEDDDSLET